MPNRAPAVRAPTTAPYQMSIGNRGYMILANSIGVDIRQQYRSFKDPNSLVPSPKGITLTPDEWQGLVYHAAAVNDCIKHFQIQTDEIMQMYPIGINGTHLVACTYNEQVLVHIRVYSRAFKDAQKVFPTKRGIALQVEEWNELFGAIDAITAVVNN